MVHRNGKYLCRVGHISIFSSNLLQPKVGIRFRCRPLLSRIKHRYSHHWDRANRHRTEKAQEPVNLTNLFRLAVVVYAAAALMFLALSWIPQELPVEAISYAEWRASQPLHAATRAATAIGIIALAVSIGSAIALLFWLRAVRLVFSACILLLLFGQLFLGYPVLISGIQSFLNTLGSISAGLVIALSYCPAVSAKYQSK